MRSSSRDDRWPMLASSEEDGRGTDLVHSCRSFGVLWLRHHRKDAKAESREQLLVFKRLSEGTRWQPSWRDSWPRLMSVSLSVASCVSPLALRSARNLPPISIRSCLTKAC